MAEATDWTMFSEQETCVVCPDCAFTFAAYHKDDTAEAGYSCPCCEANAAMTATCHLCGKVKFSPTPGRAAYLLGFHMDRRHRGWTMTDIGGSPAGPS